MIFLIFAAWLASIVAAYFVGVEMGRRKPPRNGDNGGERASRAAL
jgi:hypothetical protein